MSSSGIGGVFGEQSTSAMTSHPPSGLVPVLLVTDPLTHLYKFTESELQTLGKVFLFVVLFQSYVSFRSLPHLFMSFTSR